MTPMLANICAELEIRVVAPEKRTGTRLKPMESAAVQTMDRILERHGQGHLVMVLRTIVESKNNNRELTAPVIWAVSNTILAHPAWAEKGLAWLEAFDEIDLGDLRQRAKANRRAAKPRDAIATMLFDRLSKLFGDQRQGRLI